MGIHRKLLPSECVKASPCSSLCPCDPPLPYVPPTPLLESPDSSTKHIKISTYFIISFSVIAAASILALCGYFIYVNFFSTRNRRTRTLSSPQTEQDLLEEDHQHGPAVDHPIWYIRTAGLHQAVIGAISVCKYRKDEGLIEGTECSVCLSEFQEEESLRLLPKCNHAFHLPCIDTWLTSHTNCPMCRAPIVTDPTRIPSIDPSTSFVEQVLENNGGGGGDDDEDDMVRNEEDDRVEEENENSGSQVLTMQPRRSVSLDSSSAAKIILALETLESRESLSHSKRVLGNVKRSRSFNAKHLLSWYSRSQTKPNPPLRSF